MCACIVQTSEDDDGDPREVLRDAEAPPTDTPVPAADDAFSNPWIEASKAPGGAPLFDQLDDPAGRRYVVGGGHWQEDDDATVQRLPAVMTMERAFIDHSDSPGGAGAPSLPANPATEQPRSTIGPELAAALVSAEADQLLLVTVAVATFETGVQVAVERAMASGTIHTRRDYEQELDILLDERRERILVATHSLREEVEVAGGLVVWRGENLPFVTAALPASAIEGIASRADVQLIDVADKPGQLLDPSDGLVHQHGAQLRQFVQGGWTGERGPGAADDMIAAIVEMHKEDGGNLRSFHTGHGAWRESNPASLFRYAPTGNDANDHGRFDCTGENCEEVSVFAEMPGHHATNIAGIIFGDFTGGQLASVPAAEREPSSGFAREAQAILYLTSADSSGVVRAMDHLMGLSTTTRPHVVNNSYQIPWEPFCEGSSLSSIAANAVYLSGIAMFVGAGNIEGSATACETVSPADAIGSFAVGAHMTTYGTPLNYRGDGIFDPVGVEGSSWGGNALQGDNRSIVSITAGGPRNGLVKPDGTHTMATGAIGKTSYATAVVSAAALDLMHHQFAVGNSFIDAPGFLYALLLVMGDRNGVGGKTFSVPDHRWGVGRLRARLLGAGGMDAPWYYYLGVTCIKEGDTWDFNPVGTSLPSAVDAVKVAAYWYDHDHEANPDAPVANVDLSIRTSSAGGLINEVEADNDAHDNKAWVFEPNWPTSPAIIRLRGVDGIVGHDDPICGADSVRVYFAFFAEDSARDTVPAYSLATGEGVYPEDL